VQPFYVVEPYELSKNPAGGDYTILSGVPAIENGNGKSYTELLKTLPKPILLMVHDLGDATNRMKGFWQANQDYIDGFLCSKEETIQGLPEFVRRKPFLRIRLPFVADPFDIDWNVWKAKRNHIIFSGRIIPEKGARIVAELSDHGYKVVVAGQKVETEEYLRYYEKIQQFGATVVPNPKTDELFDRLKEAKIICSFTYQKDRYVSVEYPVLQAMNYGCVPVVANWCAKYYREADILALFVESPMEATKFIDQVYRNDNLGIKFARQNLTIVSKWSAHLETEINEFVGKIKSEGK
jgi:glycosyltransferase involved in cell wall biosynthesis